MKSDFLNDLRIASPCSVGWDSMTGDHRVRLCDQCDLHVYDISELTRDEVLALIANSEGRICARLHRRTDGTVITRDCPVGLRALRKRVARRAGAALTAVLSLSAAVFGQTRTPDRSSCSNVKVTKLEREQSPDQKPLITGIVTDPHGAAVPGATITLTETATKKTFTTSTTAVGEFRFADLNSGEYSLDIARFSFARLVLTQLLKPGEGLRVEATLEPQVTLMSTVSSGIMEMAISVEDKPIYSNGTMRLGGDLIQRLPH